MVDIRERKAGFEEVLGYFEDGGKRCSFPTEETKATISTPQALEYNSESAFLLLVKHQVVGHVSGVQLKKHSEMGRKSFEETYNDRYFSATVVIFRVSLTPLRICCSEITYLRLRLLSLWSLNN